MHELSIVQTLIEQVEEEVERSGHDGRVVSLDLVIGRFSGVCVDSIRFAFEMLAPDTSLDGAKICVTEPKAVCRCLSCSASTEFDELAPACPECGSDEIVIEGGRELVLQSIELEG